MATRRQGNWLGQQRVDVSDMRAIESGVAYDFDVLAGRMLAGKTPLVIRGFSIGTTNTVGTSADSLQLNVAAGLLMHYGASEAGTLFIADDNAASQILSASNSLVQGTFAAGATNYVGLDFRRSADPATSDLKKFLDATTLKEIAKTVPTGRTLQFKIIISTQPFSVASNVCPIAKVTTDANNKVVSIADARQMMFRLGSGGDTPDAGSSFAWGSRTENAVTYNASSLDDPFVGADKSLVSLKQWMDAMMTRVWEIGGGEYWYSATARDGVKLMYGEPVVTDTQDNFSWDSGTDTLTWSGLSVAFENSTAYYNTITSGSEVLSANGQCLWVDLDRSTNGAALVPSVSTLQELGSPSTPGNRYIIAWRLDDKIHVRDKAYEVGRSFPVASTTVLGIVKLHNTPGSSTAPVVVALGANNEVVLTSTGSATGLTVTGGSTGSGLEVKAGGGTKTGLIARGSGSTDTTLLDTGQALLGYASASGGSAIVGISKSADLNWYHGVEGYGHNGGTAGGQGGGGGYFEGGNGGAGAIGGYGLRGVAGDGNGANKAGGIGVIGNGGEPGAGGVGGAGGDFRGGTGAPAVVGHGLIYSDEDGFKAPDNSTLASFANKSLSTGTPGANVAAIGSGGPPSTAIDLYVTPFGIVGGTITLSITGTTTPFETLFTIDTTAYPWVIPMSWVQGWLGSGVRGTGTGPTAYSSVPVNIDKFGMVTCWAALSSGDTLFISPCYPGNGVIP